MSRFSTLMQREWLQHRRGYEWLAAAPPALLLLAIVFGWKHVQVQPGIPMLGMAIAALGVTGLVTAIVCIAVLFQLPGLARRDQQDRSIEFWSSLPVTHTASVAAPLVVHGLLVPLAALAFGFACSQVLGLLMTTAALGASSLAQVPWGMLLVSEFAGLLRMALGLVLATLWIAPLPLVLMVASAGLKRWGVPAVMATVTVAAIVLENVYGNPVIRQSLTVLFQHAGHAFLANPLTQGNDTSVQELPAMLSQLPVWAAEDAFGSLRDLFSPAFAASLAVSAACFAALVALRRRAAGG